MLLTLPSILLCKSGRVVDLAAEDESIFMLRIAKITGANE